MGISHIQTALQTAGYDPGPIDGIWGRRSTAACRAFQTAKALPVTGIPDAATVALLVGGTDTPPLVWLQEARALLGLKETTGAGSTKAILDMATGLGIPYENDEIPWCGLFVAHCIGATLPMEILPRTPLLARAWAKFGDPVTPRLGAVLVFWRGSVDGYTGHVCFYEGETDTHYLVIGGNQSDKVCSSLIPKGRLLAARWPHGAAGLASAPVPVADVAHADAGGKQD